MGIVRGVNNMRTNDKICNTYKSEQRKLYTLDVAEEILNRRRRIMSYRKKKINTYFIKQKLSGLAMITIGILITMINDGDATASLLTIPMGIGLLITKEDVMMFKK